MLPLNLKIINVLTNSSCNVSKNVPGIIWSTKRHKSFLTLNHRKHKYDQIGEGGTDNRPTPIVILHGMLGSSVNWSTLAGIISQKTGRDVYLPDARNHGSSPHDPDISYPLMAGDHRQFIHEQFAPRKAILIGHSMGARTAMTLALQDPGCVESLISIDASPIHQTTDRGQAQLDRFMVALRQAERTISTLDAKVVARQSARNMADKVLKEHGVTSCSMRNWLLMNLVPDGPGKGGYRWQFNLDAFERNFKKHLILVPPSLTKNGHSYKNRTLIIGGEKSGYIPVDSHESIRKVFPNAEFSYVPNAGHWVHVDNPNGFLEILIPFLLSL